MDTRNGNIITPSALAAYAAEQQDRKRRRSRNVHRSNEGTLVFIDPANLSPRVRAFLSAHGRAQIGRNHSCPCGSGKRFKRCHLTK